MDQIIWKKIHNWLGISSAIFLTGLLLTGLLLNHPSSLKKNVVETIQIHPANPNQLFRGGEEGFFRSSDGGKIWEEVPMLYPPQELSDIAFAPEDPEKIYILERWGRILTSKDGGHIWNAVPLPFDPQSEGVELKQLSIGPLGE
ncbi:MAG: hypothetical protein HYY63_04260, partial [Elusimicrobia bacterium]|nr:hypothetical protein [Elusimicrobiota bacterium]